MSGQLELTFEPPKPVKIGGMQQWMKARLRSHARYEPQYNPGRTRKLLLSLLNHDEWTGFIGLPDRVGQTAEQTSHVLDFLLIKGRIETTPLYFLPHGSLLSNRTEHPGYDGNYQGYEEGFRLKKL
jgi:hypothetical protein